MSDFDHYKKVSANRNNTELMDIVQLKSGGPYMVVDSIDPIGSVNCVWFNEKGNDREGDFNISLLNKIEY